MANVPFGNSGSDNVYFAAKAGNETASILLNKGSTFFDILRANAYLDKLAMMWKFYHGVMGSGNSFNHTVSFTGEQGELVSLPINHFRNLAQHIYVMVTSNRPIMESRAINSDYKSLAQTYLANGILEYYMREKHLEDCIKKAAEMCIVMGAGYVKLAWNATAGEAYDVDPDTGEFSYEGELEFSNLSPLDVVMDGTRESWDNDWLLVRTYKNRFDLMAKYPEHADVIRSVPSKNGSSSQSMRIAVFTNDDTDDIPVFEFYHKRTESMPNGRYMLFASEDAVLLDTKMPYRVIPIFRVAPGDIIGTPYAYTPMFDMYPIQEAINSMFSSLMTNHNAFAVQNIFIKRGSDIAIQSIEGALNIIEANEKPEAIQLTANSPDAYKFLEMLVQAGETITGVNGVTRGNPEASLKSGTALALVQSMSLQFISGLQQSYVKMIEDVGTALIQILKDFADTPKTVALVGKNNRSLLKEFVGEDISSINRVIVDVGNPLSRCLAKDTPVLMYDGTIKKVQDIEIGEQLMGPDSYPRTVSNTNSGQEMMYDIISKDPHRNIKYGCNESHILTLKYCSDDYRYDVKKGDILDITVKDYLKLTERQKRLLQGFTVGVEYENKNLDIPPYILGSWLGDGTSRTTAITTMDKEMVDEWTNYANSIEMSIRVQENRQPNKSKVYFITSGESHGKSDRNPFMNYLRSMELICNKHIPFIYLTSSRKDRLELLAGLLDTDGHRIGETFIFTQKSERLTQDVIYLAKSLGFRVTCKKIKSNSSKLVGELNSECFKVSIGGDTWEIPNKLPRKQVKEKDKSRDPLNYGIKVECKGMGTYYGFTLKEEPHFLLGDFTVTHNTIAGRVQMAEQLLQMKLITSPEMYFQVINTGRLDAMYEGEMSELLLVKSENERLMEGEQVKATLLDQHKLHIQEHKSVLADPDLRRDPNLVNNVLSHIQEHIDLLRNGDPELLQLIGEQPLQPPPQPQGPPQGPPQMPPQGGPQQVVHVHGNANIPPIPSMPAHVQGNPAPQMMAPPSGPSIPNKLKTINGPGVHHQGLPNLPKIHADLLPNAALQQNAMNNVKF